ncbi:hypothetical protein DUNSADRAFT_16009 [Dunaliella salina]|uniref:Uncharacterized protein n=1 Tax=Dunaliella salina TaxID=3046 RepID=A0ABQ7H1A4_DUNSA|nr:hypothetical protein DUNSADRAFT_16009 [Dunaliella salina]|eukprot:KAF5840636.1 hypothetical protein DUNSADRAFT_16009 [Dunaliella salina]
MKALQCSLPPSMPIFMKADLATLARWIWGIMHHNQPDNRALKKHVKAVLSEHQRHGPHGSASKKSILNLPSLESTRTASKQQKPPEDGHDVSSSWSRRKRPPSRAASVYMDLDWSQLYALLHGEVHSLNDNPLFNSSSSMLDSPFSSSARPTAEIRTAMVPNCTDDTESGHCWTMSSKGAHPGAHASDQPC